MTMHIEWIPAKSGVAEFVDSDWMAEHAPEGNDVGDVGVYVGGDDGAVIYGSLSDVSEFLDRAHTQIQGIQA